MDYYNSKKSVYDYLGDRYNKYSDILNSFGIKAK